MNESTVIQLSALTGWIVGVSHVKDHGYQCWVINPDLDLLSNGAVYTTSSAAMAAGRHFVERHR